MKPTQQNRPVYHDFDIVGVYRADHDGALTALELEAAKAAAITFGKHSTVIGNRTVRVFRTMMTAMATMAKPAAEEAVATFKELAPGCEVISCDHMGEVKNEGAS